MKYIYAMINGGEWEDLVIFVTEEEAIRASIENPNNRIEIFAKKMDSSGYSPIYYYYLNGKLY